MHLNRHCLCFSRLQAIVETNSHFIVGLSSNYFVSLLNLSLIKHITADQNSQQNSDKQNPNSDHFI